MKKIISLLLVVALVLSASITVAAHSHGGSVNHKAKYSVCAMENCTKTGSHAHNGKTYTAHYYGDGHDYHDEYCSIKSCKLSGYHEHDGEYCFAHTANDGHKQCALKRHHR